VLVNDWQHNVLENKKLHRLGIQISLRGIQLLHRYSTIQVVDAISRPVMIQPTVLPRTARRLRPSNVSVASSRGSYNAPQQGQTMGIPMNPRIATSKIASSHIIPSYATHRAIHTSARRLKPILEPRLEDHGRVIHDEYSLIRDKYGRYSAFFLIQLSPSKS
jgi:hypothetical protein